jgi:hypothetical protein
MDPLIGRSYCQTIFGFTDLFPTPNPLAPLNPTDYLFLVRYKTKTPTPRGFFVRNYGLERFRRRRRGELSFSTRNGTENRACTFVHSFLLFCILVSSSSVKLYYLRGFRRIRTPLLGALRGSAGAPRLLFAFAPGPQNYTRAWRTSLSFSRAFDVTGYTLKPTGKLFSNREFRLWERNLYNHPRYDSMRKKWPGSDPKIIRSKYWITHIGSHLFAIVLSI